MKGLRENSYEVHLCYYGFDCRGHRCRYVDDKVIKDYGKRKLAGLLQRADYRCVYDYCKQNGIQFIYAPCFQNANPWLICFFHKLNKVGIHSVTEIPTYPYDEEFATFPLSVKLELKIDQLFRNHLGHEMLAFVTNSDVEEIFGQRTIQPYVLKAPADETPINVQQTLDFINSRHFNPQEIRKTVEHLM